MNIQSETVRKYVLDRLEDGRFTSGRRLPGSRKISEELNISRPVVQNALDTLVNEGVLKAEQRSGLYVDPSWQYRRIQGCLHIYRKDTYLPWVAQLRTELGKQLPQLHISNSFQESPFRIVTTATAQTAHEGMMDLMPVLKECYPDLSLFYTEQLKPFMQYGRLTALPFLFSPRIIACNREILAEAGCHVPSPDWCIEDLLELTGKLKKHHSDRPVFRWSTNIGHWLNFILNCGGQLFDPESADPVKFDSPEAIKGLHYYRLLRDEQQIAENMDFYGSAITIIDRQFYGMYLKDVEKQYLFLPIPGDRPERNGVSIQATELLSIRLDGIDRGLIRPIVRFLWSEEFQDHLAQLKYGIPIRRSSAEKSFAENTPADAAFKQARISLRSMYQLYDSKLFSLITSGMSRLLRSNDDLNREVFDLAYTVRQYIKYMNLFPPPKNSAFPQISRKDQDTIPGFHTIRRKFS